MLTSVIKMGMVTWGMYVTSAASHRHLRNSFGFFFCIGFIFQHLKSSLDFNPPCCIQKVFHDKWKHWISALTCILLIKNPTSICIRGVSGLHGGAVLSASQHRFLILSPDWTEPLQVKFACSCACRGSLQVFQHPSTAKNTLFTFSKLP